MLPYTVEEEAVVEAEDTDAKDVDGKDERDSNFTKQQQRQRLDAVRTIVRTRPPGMPARTKRLTTPLMMVSNCFLSSSVLFQSCQSRLVVSCRVLSCRVALHDPSDCYTILSASPKCGTGFYGQRRPKF